MNRFVQCSAVLAATVLLNGCPDPNYFGDPEHQKRVEKLINTHLRPVTVESCNLQRFGDRHDGGYIVCGDLLNHVEAVYSYGIEGRDFFCCEMGAKLGVPVHQFDPFDTRRPSCNTSSTVFHEEGIGAHHSSDTGRVFDSLENQLGKNKDLGKKLLVKMDVEGAEWDSLLHTPDSVLENIHQLVIELHWLTEKNSTDKISQVLEKLGKHFHVAHLHVNNHRCGYSIGKFPADTYEVTYVNKKIANANDVLPVLPNPLDAPCGPSWSNCDLNSTHFE